MGNQQAVLITEISSGIGAIHPDGLFDFSACLTHNYREFLGNFTELKRGVRTETGCIGPIDGSLENWSCGNGIVQPAPESLERNLGVW